MIFDWMPLIFMLASFSAGLLIYWAWNNTLSVLQQSVIMHKHGAKIELWDNIKVLRGEEKGRRGEEEVGAGGRLRFRKIVLLPRRVQSVIYNFAVQGEFGGGQGFGATSKDRHREHQV
jgi:hypothetical protein